MLLDLTWKWPENNLETIKGDNTLTVNKDNNITITGNYNLSINDHHKHRSTWYNHYGWLCYNQW